MSFTLCLMKEFNSSFLNDMVKEADGVEDHVIMHIKYWLFLLIALVAIFWAWPQFWPESWCREN